MTEKVDLIMFKPDTAENKHLLFWRSEIHQMLAVIAATPVGLSPCHSLLHLAAYFLQLIIDTREVKFCWMLTHFNEFWKWRQSKVQWYWIIKRCLIFVTLLSKLMTEQCFVVTSWSSRLTDLPGHYCHIWWHNSFLMAKTFIRWTPVPTLIDPWPAGALCFSQSEGSKPATGGRRKGRVK